MNGLPEIRVTVYRQSDPTASDSDYYLVVCENPGGDDPGTFFETFHTFDEAYAHARVCFEV